MYIGVDSCLDHLDSVSMDTIVCLLTIFLLCLVYIFMRCVFIIIFFLSVFFSEPMSAVALPVL